MIRNKSEHMIRLTVRLCRGDVITIPVVMRYCNVSLATAKRYLNELECVLPLSSRIEERRRVYKLQGADQKRRYAA